MRIFLAGLGLGLGLGLLSGWLFFGGDPAGPGASRSMPVAERSRIDAEAGGPATTDPRTGPPEEGAPWPDDPSGPISVAEAVAQIDALQATLLKVEAEAEDAQQTLETIRQEARAAEEKEHARIPFPEDLPERFAQDPLMRSVDEALQKLGGEISAVDCTEYPCIVYADLPGHGVPPPVEFKNFMSDPAMQPYAEDSRMHFAYDDTDEAGNHLARHTGFAFFPKDTEGGSRNSELGERIHRRVREWRKATTSPVEP